MVFAAASDAMALFANKISIRSALADDELAAVLALPATPRRIGPHCEIVRLGEHLEHACLVAEGLVARFAQMEDGRRQFISLHIPGDMVDLYSLMLPAAPSPLVALTPTTVLQIPHGALRELAFNLPNLAAAFWRECVVDGNIVAQWLVNVGRMEARGRLAHLLCEMAVRSSQIGEFKRGTYPFGMTQEQMGDALGLTSVHVNRSLQALRRDNLIRLSRGEVEILDWAGLCRTAEFDAGYLHLPDLVEASARSAFH